MVFQTQIEVGNTVRYTATFTDFDGKPVDPLTIKFKTYDKYYVELSSNDMQKATDKLGEPIVGSYFYDYTPQEIGDYWVECMGYIDGTPALIREKVQVKFDVKF